MRQTRAAGHPGSGNGFEDLGLPDPDIELAKCLFLRQLRDAIAARKLTAPQAAGLLKVEAKRFQALLDGRTTGFTIDRLIRMLNKLGRRADITVCTRPDGAGLPSPGRAAE